MERGDHWLRDGGTANDLFDALGHFSCSLIRKGDGEDRFRHCPDVLDQMSDSIGDDACLAATRAGQDQQRTVNGLNRLALLRV
jgi:hypothetical protein